MKLNINKKNAAIAGLIGAVVGVAVYAINKKCGGKIMETTKKCADVAKDVTEDLAKEVVKETVKESVKEAAKEIIEESVIGKVADNTEIKIDINVADCIGQVMRPIENVARYIIVDKPAYTLIPAAAAAVVILAVGVSKKYANEAKRDESA